MRGFRRLAAVGALLILASCTGQPAPVTDGGPGVSGEGEPPAVPLSEPLSPGDAEPNAQQAIPPEPSPRPGDPVRESDALVRDLPDRPRIAFPSLIGLTDLELEGALGKPDSVSSRPPATVWRYELSGCALELFLFPDVAKGAPKALTYEAREIGRTTADPADPRCEEVRADG